VLNIVGILEYGGGGGGGGGIEENHNLESESDLSRIKPGCEPHGEKSRRNLL